MVTLITENYQMIVVTFFGGGGGIFYLFFFCLGLVYSLFCLPFFVFFVFYFDDIFFENDKIRLLEELMTQNSCVIRLRV